MLTNKEIFNHQTLADFENVKSFYEKGNTETQEWKKALEKLMFSLEITLRTMEGEDNNG